MTQDQQQNRRQTRDDRSAPRQPDLIGYAVNQGKGARSASWTRIGAAWAHKDGNGYDVRLQALPVDGRLTLRFREEADGPDLVDRDDRSEPVAYRR